MKSTPIPFHTDQASHVARQHDGVVPAAWTVPAMPSEGFAKAAVIAAIAWQAVKPAADPSFLACTLAHRENLIAEVEALLKCGAPSDRSTLTPFLEAAKAFIDEMEKREPNLLEEQNG